MAEHEILTKIESMLPSYAEISESRFEAAEVVLFSENTEFLEKSEDILKNIAKELKMRIEARADKSLLLSHDESMQHIKTILGEAGITSVFFDNYRSRVLIELEKPSIALANNQEKVKKLKRIIRWTPIIYRKPPLKSDIINTIRKILTDNSKERAKFLHEVGLRIYSEGKPSKWIRASFLGAAKEVGRSSILVQTPESRILLDCGVSVAGKDPFPALDAPEFNISALDAVIISHAHLDHSGFLPFLYKYGYKGPAYMTPPTLALSVLLQLDYLEVAQREGYIVPYSAKEIEQEVLHTITIPYKEVVNITPDTKITLHNAGHILGSAVIHLHVGEGFYNLIYTGDIKFSESKLHDPAENVFPRAEAVIIESTYGGEQDIQPEREESVKNLLKAVRSTLRRKGKVLIPVLGAGRAQEVMLILEEAMRKRRLKKVPVFIDGIVWDATAIYTTYPEYLKEEIAKQVFAYEENPLLSDIFNRVGSQKERDEVIARNEPLIVLATSGMLTGGPSVNYFINFAPYEKNSIIFVNYQAEGTLGRKVQKKPEEIVVNYSGKKEVVKLALDVHTIEGFSAHADRKELMNYIGTMKPRPQIVLPVHGEPKKVSELGAGFRKEYKLRVRVPNILDAFRLR